jgi:hypothetical protein
VDSLPSKRRILERRRREQGLKNKRDETSYEEALCFKKEKKKRG